MVVSYTANLYSRIYWSDPVPSKSSSSHQKIGQICLHEKIRIENPVLEVELRMSDVGCRDASCTHAVLPYGIQLYLGTHPEVVNIWHVCTVHCVYTLYTLYTL